MNKPYIEINFLHEIQGHLKSPKDTLIVFDIDYVLTQPIERAFQFPIILKEIEFVKKIFYELSPSERDLLGNLMVMEEPGSCLIEKDSPNFIEQLTNRGYKSIALTAGLTAVINNRDLKQEKVARLKELKINFSSSFPHLSPCIYDHFETNFNSYPEYEQGIIFCNGENREIQKGTILKQFLSQIDFTPSTLLVIDDRDKNLEAISLAFSEMPLEVKCFLYKGCLNSMNQGDFNENSFKLTWTKLVEKVKEIDQKFAQLDQKTNNL